MNKRIKKKKLKKVHKKMSLWESKIYVSVDDIINNNIYTGLSSEERKKLLFGEWIKPH